MDFILEISRYLKGELSYKEGVDLYLQYGNKNALKAIFQKEDAFSRRKLKAELQAILDWRKPDPKAIDESKKNVEHAFASRNPQKMSKALRELYTTMGLTNDYQSYSPSKKRGTIDVEKLPPHLKTEYYKQISYTREISATNAKLQLMPSDEDRRVAAQRIVDLAAQRRAIFARIDYFLENGHDRDQPAALPVDHKVSPTQDIGWHQAQHELKLLRSQRSRLRNNAARRSDFEKVCNRISELENIIGNGKTV